MSIPFNFTVIVNSGAGVGATDMTFTAATGFTFDAVANTLTWNQAGPVPANTVMGDFTVTPANWTGTLALSGTGDADLVIAGNVLSVGTSDLANGNYAVSVLPTP